MYRIEYFDDVILPTARPEDDLGSGSVDSGIVSVLGGGFDGYGTRVVMPSKRIIRHRGIYTRPGFFVDHSENFLVDESNNFLVWNDDDNEIITRLMNLSGLIGQRRTLWRKREYDSARQWLECRLVDVSATRTVVNANNVLEVAATFEAATAAWKSSSQVTEAGSLGGSGTVALETTNDGGLPIFDAELVITATASITTISVVGMGTNITIAVTMTSGQSLLIDCGEPSILLNGVAAYSGLTINSGHSIRGWLQVNTEHNVWYVTANGSCNISLEYYPQWP